jgi:RNA polymerase sigma-70 factor (ECF subfamily)
MNRQEAAATENRLLAAVALGDHEAFQELYASTARSVYFFLYRMTQDESLAEDLQVEVFAQVWKGAGKFKGRSRVRTWIFGIARNLALNELRKTRYHVNIDDCHHLSDGRLPDPGDADRHRFLLESLDAISAKHREVLDLVFFQQMNYAEVAEVLEISVNTVKTRVFYAKAALRKVFQKKGVERNDI